LKRKQRHLASASVRLPRHGVMQISLDATWSMLRFRPRAEIKIMTRKF
jgi:hypothetical protein